MNDPRPTEQLDWAEANQRDLMNALASVRQCLEAHVEAGGEEHRQAAKASVSRVESGYAVDMLSGLFGLSAFERDTLLLCAGMELDGLFPSLVAKAGGGPGRDRPDFALALAALPGAHWSALTPAAPLRRWRLVELGSGSSLVRSPLRIDERVLHFLTGITHLDEHLEGFVTPLALDDGLEPSASQQALAERIAAAWSIDSAAAVVLTGYDTAIKQAVARGVADRLGARLHVLPARVLPATPQDLDILIRLWQREAALSNSALLLDCDDSDPTDGSREDLIRRFIDQVGGVLLIGSERRRQARQRPLIQYAVKKPGSEEQRRLWESRLGTAVNRLNGSLPSLVSQFDLGPTAIRAACDEVVAAGSGDADPARLGERLWDACRNAARPRLEDLAQRIEPVATWDELVLPEIQLQTLRAIAMHVRQRARVYEDWGFAERSSQGLGIAALFAGASGTGKTMAAEVLANALRLDLYRIDLSQVVSKYIGETEKNLRRVFDAAETGGAILLFDEADALFGKRSEVKDSHDRYANIEVSYLLQRMETYRGLAILTTNLKSALDTAFLRRLRFVVQFPFPDREQRAAIWRRIYPSATPIEDLDWSRLARLSVAGGNIRNIALNAAFLAAEDDSPVDMTHVLDAARLEYAKLERPLTELKPEGGGNGR